MYLSPFLPPINEKANGVQTRKVTSDLLGELFDGAQLNDNVRASRSGYMIFENDNNIIVTDDNVKNAITVPYNSNMPSLNPKPGNVLVRYDVVKQSDIEGRYELRVQNLVRNNNNGWDTIIDEKITYETTALAVNPFEDNITYIDTRD